MSDLLNANRSASTLIAAGHCSALSVVLHYWLDVDSNAWLHQRLHHTRLRL
jgi:hypothetical protein